MIVSKKGLVRVRINESFDTDTEKRSMSSGTWNELVSKEGIVIYYMYLLTMDSVARPE